MNAATTPYERPTGVTQAWPRAAASSRVRPSSLATHDLGVIGLPDHGFDTLHDQQITAPALHERVFAVLADRLRPRG